MQTLNTDTLANLRDFMPPAELREFLERVNEELSAAWPRMEGFWQATDWAQLEKGAHRLKSVMGSIGCEALYQALDQLETDLRASPARLPGDTQLSQLRIFARDTHEALARVIADT